MTKLLFLSLISLAGLQAVEYKIVYNITAVASDALTIQHPATGLIKDTLIPRIWVSCTARCRVILRRTGTAATTTAAQSLIVVANESIVNSPLFKVFRQSNSTGGVTIFDDWIPAAGTYPIAYLGNARLSGLGTTHNYTISVAFATGTGDITYNVNVQD